MRKLNLGNALNPLPEYENIDIKAGHSVYPLKVEPGSVDVIRASHLLEHFPFTDVPLVLANWNKALKPGGKLILSVPDAMKIASPQFAADPNRWRYLLGGQLDEWDYHKSCFDESSLRNFLHRAGFDKIKSVKADPRDASSHPISLNVQAIKGPREPKTGCFEARVKAIMSLPRLGFNDHWNCAQRALQSLGIELAVGWGVFWGQSMENMLEDAIAQNVDWVLTLDYDTMFKAEHVKMLMMHVAENPEIDAIAAFQQRRLGEYPLLSVDKRRSVTIKPGEAKRVSTAHFGLTLIRTEAVKRMPKPWFKPIPNADGRWREGKIDDDVTFWKQFTSSGGKVFVDTGCRVGHLELMVSEFDENYKSRYTHVVDWWRREYGNVENDSPSKTVASVPKRASRRRAMVKHRKDAGPTGDRGVRRSGRLALAASGNSHASQSAGNNGQAGT